MEDRGGTANRISHGTPGVLAGMGTRTTLEPRASNVSAPQELVVRSDWAGASLPRTPIRTAPSCWIP